MRLAPPALICAALLAAPAFAKLPAPSPEAKAKAAETTAKAAWTDKVSAFQLCRAIDRTVEHYRKSAKPASAPAAVESPACVDPGPFVYVAPPPATPPLEAAGAHSPPAPATAPPSGKATAAELQGQPKK